MSWFDMNRDSFQAARLVQKHRHWRSAVSRAYFAAYAAITGVLEQAGAVDFRFGGRNRGHRQLLALAANNLDVRVYGPQTRKRIKRSLNILQTQRVNADDNDDQEAITNDDVVISLRNATSVLLALGVLR